METVIGIVTALVTCITLIYNTFFSKDKKREKIYYEKVLQPFIVELSENEKISASGMLGGTLSRSDDDIPKYIFYLLDEGREEELKKVLICDYLLLYPNDRNNVERLLDIVSKILFYVGVITSIILLFIGVFCVTGTITGVLAFVLNKILGYKTGENLWSAFTLLISGCVCIILSRLVLKNDMVANEDRYELKQTKIDKMIKQKVKKYDKMIGKYVL